MSRLTARQMRRAFDKERRRNVLAKPGCHHFIIVCDGLKSDFNIGKIFRSAEAFGAQAVHLVGADYFNPYPSRGTFRQVPAKFFTNFEQSYEALRQAAYTPLVVTSRADVTLSEMKLPQHSAFIFGHEEFGHSFELEDYPDVMPVRIPMYGCVESLNVSVAAAIVMYEYVRQHAGPDAK